MTLKLEKGIYILLASIIYLWVHIKFAGMYANSSEPSVFFSLYESIGKPAIFLELLFTNFISLFITSLILSALFNNLSSISVAFIAIPVLAINTLFASGAVIYPAIASAVLSVFVFIYLCKILIPRFVSPLKHTFEFERETNDLNKYINLLISAFSVLFIVIFLSFSIDIDAMVQRSTFPYLNIAVIIEIILLYNLRFKPSITLAMLAVPIFIFTLSVITDMVTELASIFFTLNS